MSQPWVNPSALYELHKVREQELFAKAKASRLSEEAKRASSFTTASANSRLMRDRILPWIGDFLVTSCLRLK